MNLNNGDMLYAAVYSGSHGWVVNRDAPRISQNLFNLFLYYSLKSND